jgi:hypothetical protein
MRSPYDISIDYTAPLETQFAQLDNLMRNPPGWAPKITFSPELAKHIVTTMNSRNRGRKEDLIKFIMKRGYEDIGGIILFSRGRLLLDGQNRLWACAYSGEPMETYVGFGIDDLAFKLLDGGKKRSLADLLGIQKVDNHIVAAAATRWIIWIRAAWESERGKVRYPTIHPADGIDWFNANIDVSIMKHCTDRALRISNKMVPGYTAAAQYLFWAASKSDKASDFMDNIEFEHKRTAAWRLYNDKGGIGRKQAKRIENDVQMAWIIQCMNGHPHNWAGGDQRFPTVE